jgi:nucleoside-diphosphate-sugar epimerase
VYDESKRFAEALTWEYRRTYSTNARIIRIFNTYGPGMALNDGRAIPAFAVAALTNEPMRIQGTGDHTRCFCFVDDLVRGLLAIGQNPDADGEVYNIGNDHEITVLELAETIRDIVGSSSELVREDEAADDPTRRKPDLTRIRRDYGWSATIDLREGLTRTLADIEQRLHKSGAHAA